MIHNGNDQAAGLRRLLEGGSRRIVTVVPTAAGDERYELLLNLASALVALGRDVLVVDADQRSGRLAKALGVDAAPTLLDAASGICSVGDAVRTSMYGFEVAVLAPPAVPVAPGRVGRLDGALQRASDRADITLVAMASRADQGWSLPAIARADIVVQVANSRPSITAGYRLIKQLAVRLGRRPFGILVTGATADQGSVVGGNVARAASRYLALSINPVGAIPADEHLGRAAVLGRSVVDAFPRAHAAIAYRRLAAALSQPQHARSSIAASAARTTSANAEFGL